MEIYNVINVIGITAFSISGVSPLILLNNIPLIFQKEIYAVASISGGIIYVLLTKTSLPETITYFACIFLIVLIRMIALKNNWSLPAIRGKLKT